MVTVFGGLLIWKVGYQLTGKQAKDDLLRFGFAIELQLNYQDEDESGKLVVFIEIVLDVNLT
jgi:hypothetical protein